ncbi:MAG TPA: HAMP domain-containing sensor histidine kinase [Kofleriaceae bacterium]|nr:HAMP domain-containing sensor histidine kinase [Kofleriaceae bacterium]
MRPRPTILVKLLVALVVPTVALFTIFALIAYDGSRRDLDDELGRRLESIAASVATQVRAKYVIDLGPGDELERGYQNIARKLETFANVHEHVHLTLFDDHYGSRGDSEGETPIGTRYFRAELDREEISRVWRGQTASSVTFVGQDGQWYKAGYAPVRMSDEDPTIALVLRAEAPASYFDRLKEQAQRLVLWGAILVLVSILAAVITTLFITRNIRRLAAAAERIGGGELRQRVAVTSNDELGVLAETMDRMRKQLADRDARTQQMLAGIAHEVRNPLAGMTLFAGILRDELPEGDERRGHVDRIQRELGYLERVVNDFLEYARRPRPELRPVESDDLLAEVAQLATTDAIEIAVEPGKVELRGDPGQLRRALLNLAKNAVQAATAAGHRGKDAVRLSAHRRGDDVHFEVWNRGKEIAPETSGKLFEPFYTTREKGTGLGLAFVREIAIDHGGRVEVASASGETTFTLVIPAGV